MRLRIGEEHVAVFVNTPQAREGVEEVRSAEHVLDPVGIPEELELFRRAVIEAVFIYFIVFAQDTPLEQALGIFPDQVVQELDGSHGIFTVDGDAHALRGLYVGDIPLPFFN